MVYSINLGLMAVIFLIGIQLAVVRKSGSVVNWQCRHMPADSIYQEDIACY